MSLFEEMPKLATNDHGVWAEKYRPETLDGYICDERVRAIISDFIKRKDVPGHLLFHGSAGTGKTTLAKIITKNIPCDVMYVNASDNTGVDFVRDKIKPFAATMGFNDLKIVILDECLDENTLVYVLKNGEEVSLKIKDVDEKNDLVKSYNIKENKIEWRTFYLWDKGQLECVQIELENGELVVCTLDHKWYVNDVDGNPTKVKTSELLSRKYDYILSPQ